MKRKTKWEFKKIPFTPGDKTAEAELNRLRSEGWQTYREQSEKGYYSLYRKISSPEFQKPQQKETL